MQIKIGIEMAAERRTAKFIQMPVTGKMRPDEVGSVRRHAQLAPRAMDPVGPRARIPAPNGGESSSEAISGGCPQRQSRLHQAVQCPPPPMAAQPLAMKLMTARNAGPVYERWRPRIAYRARRMVMLSASSALTGTCRVAG